MSSLHRRFHYPISIIFFSILGHLLLLPEANCLEVKIKLLTNVQLLPTGHFLLRLYARQEWDELAENTLVTSKPSSEKGKRKVMESQSSVMSAIFGEDSADSAEKRQKIDRENSLANLSENFGFSPQNSPSDSPTTPKSLDNWPSFSLLKNLAKTADEDDTSSAADNENISGIPAGKSKLHFRVSPTGVPIPPKLHWLAECRIYSSEENVANFEVPEGKGHKFVVEIRMIQPYTKRKQKMNSRKVARYTTQYSNLNSNAQPIDYEPGTLTKCFLDHKGIVACSKSREAPIGPELLFHMKFKNSPYWKFSNFVHQIYLSCAQKFEGRSKTARSGGGGADWRLVTRNRIGEVDTRMVASNQLKCPENNYKIRIQAIRVVVNPNERVWSAYVPYEEKAKKKHNTMPMKQKTTKSRKRKMDNAMDDPLATKREYVVDKVVTNVQCPAPEDRKPKPQELTEYRFSLDWTKIGEAEMNKKGKEKMDKVAQKNEIPHQLEEQESVFRVECKFYDWERVDGKEETEKLQENEKLAEELAQDLTPRKLKGKGIELDEEMMEPEETQFQEYAEDEDQEDAMVLEALQRSTKSMKKDRIGAESASHLASGAGSSLGTEWDAGNEISPAAGDGRHVHEPGTGKDDGEGSGRNTVKGRGGGRPRKLPGNLQVASSLEPERKRAKQVATESTRRRSQRERKQPKEGITYHQENDNDNEGDDEKSEEYGSEDELWQEEEP